MNRAKFAAARTIVGTDDVRILAVGPNEAHLRFVGGDAVLPIWYREDTEEPRAGDTLPTWVDVSTRYVMATVRS
jgi:hypothetical protein